MLRIEAASLVDMAELGGAQTRVHWAILREMWSRGDAWSLWDGEDLVGLAGVYPVTCDAWEAWFNLTPSIGNHLPELLKAMRLTLQSGAYREIATVCGTRAGKVMARRMGLSFAGVCEHGEIWTCKLSREAERATTEPRISPSGTGKSSSGAVSRS
jgi:hypothetical protein